MPTMIESEQEFRQRHGDFVKLKDGRLELFEDGAEIEHIGYGQGDRMLEPHADKKKNLQARRLYHSTKAGICEQAFAGLRRALLLETPIPWKWPDETLGAVPVGLDGKQVLQELRSRVHFFREAIAALDAELNALPEVVAEAERRRSIEEVYEARRRAQELEMADVRGIVL